MGGGAVNQVVLIGDHGRPVTSRPQGSGDRFERSPQHGVVVLP